MIKPGNWTAARMIKRGAPLWTLLGVLLLLSHCRPVEEDCRLPLSRNSLTEAPPGFPEIPFPEDNGYTDSRWLLGKKLFFDPVLSVDSSISCASCHLPSLAFSDDRDFSPGVENRPGVRNAMPLINLAYAPYYLREGSVPTLEMQVLVPIQEENEFDHNIVAIGEQLATDPEYVEMSWAAYGRDPDPFMITRALSTFQRTLISGNSPYDQWLSQGCNNALSLSQQRGRELFFSEKTGCSNCHSGFNFTNYAFENNGLYAVYEDPGRMRFTNDPADSARFKVPTLRNVAVTGPYMHDGSMADLAEVIEHYNSGGAAHVHKSEFVRPLELREQEKKDLIHFLESLTDTDFLTNPNFQEPLP